MGGEDGVVGASGGMDVGDDGGVDNRGVFCRNGCTDLSGQRRPYSSQL